jgi:hypothetical protein
MAAGYDKSGCPTRAGVWPASSAKRDSLIGRQTLPTAAFSTATSAPSLAQPRCSTARDPRRENHTTYTAVAPKAVFTMRTLATRAAQAPEFSAQIPTAQTEKQQVNPLRLSRTPNREPSQGRSISAASTRVAACNSSVARWLARTFWSTNDEL